ncbi:hypothetical protein [Streptomyces sp. NPDC000983]|uniref:hypothetical protein n=1 Tax=Streptomyces sp. NPDC000983 TaxID=3154373 RepID=UPI0033326FAF
MREADDFQPRWTHQQGLPDGTTDIGVSLRRIDGLVRVKPAVSSFGMPRRWRRPPAVRLAPGQWLRWQVNYRFAGSNGGDWTYRLDTLNLAHGPVPVDVFLGTPTRLVQELAALR